MPPLGTAERVINHVGVNSFAFNWEEEPDLKLQLDLLIQEVHDQNMLDPGLAYFYAAGSPVHMNILAAIEEWKAAYLALLRPAVFKLLGQNAPLNMEDSEAFLNFMDRLLARAQELIDDLLGSTPSTEIGMGPITHGFKNPLTGEDYVLPITRLTRF